MLVFEGILSTWASAFLLVCFRMLRELLLFLCAMVFLILAFAISVCTLRDTFQDFSRADRAMLSLSEVALGLYPSSRFEQLEQMSMLMIPVSVFILISLVFLLNLLIAQLNSAYQAVFQAGPACFSLIAKTCKASGHGGLRAPQQRH